MEDNCVFCRELVGSRDTNFARLYPEFDSRIIAETKDLVVFPCIGQLTDGHSLVITKKHYSNFAQAFNSLPDLDIQLASVIADAHEVLAVNPDDSLYFEHGAINSDHGGCGIYHAHLHLVPKAGSVKVGSVSGFDPIIFNSLVDAYTTIKGVMPYALIGTQKYGFGTEKLEFALPSQTIRRKVASALGSPVWDWRDAGQEQGMIELLSRKLA
ncbi:HIT family protein [Pseudomonas viridiflava]|uniref:HIT family protein n=1 Tax=Pseudomonas viridiflava TaxID=33069 RepID=UPI000F039D5D|nr:HIT domain-containing protein [Pseudomonas viridiflava]